MTRRPTVLRGMLAAARLVRDAVSAGLVVAIALPIWLLPHKAAAAVGRAYGVIAFFFLPAARRTGLINLRRAYGPSMTRSDARVWTRQVCGNLGAAVAEGLQFARRFGTGRNGWDTLYVPEDPHLEGCIVADPRPKIFVTGHLGSWEVAMMLAGKRVGGRGAAIARPIDNPFLDALFEWMRRRAGAWRLLDKRGAARAALGHIRQGGSLALLLDENAGYEGVFVDFFGRAASTRKTAALLSAMTSAPIVVGAAVRRGSGRFFYRLALIEPPERDSATATLEVTQHIVHTFERWIRDDPQQWRWVHWRWKTRPDGTEETYNRRDVRRAFEDNPT